jgi:N-acetylglucosaminyl-diphospho-decaprenol L-rhamnosyltransferase
MNIDLSIVIVGWNTKVLLKQCLDSVYANPPQCNFDVWVVDNSSSDDSVSMVKSCFPGIHLIENRKNVGFAAANNQALQQCQGTYILLLNPDTIVKQNVFDRLLSYMKDNPQVGGTGPRLLNGDGSFQLSCYPFPSVSREFWRLFYLDKIIPYGIYDSQKWNQNTPRDVDSIQGACLLVRKEALSQVGTFDESFFLYSEEIDLCYRIKKGGWQLAWIPDVEVIHFGGQSSKQVATQSFLNLYRGKVKFFRKHYGNLSAWLYCWVLVAATLARLAVSPFAWLEPSPRRKVHLGLAQNYFQLLKAIPSF